MIIHTNNLEEFDFGESIIMLDDIEYSGRNLKIKVWGVGIVGKSYNNDMYLKGYAEINIKDIVYAVIYDYDAKSKDNVIFKEYGNIEYGLDLWNEFWEKINHIELSYSWQPDIQLFALGNVYFDRNYKDGGELFVWGRGTGTLDYNEDELITMNDYIVNARECIPKDLSF